MDEKLRRVQWELASEKQSKQEVQMQLSVLQGENEDLKLLLKKEREAREACEAREKTAKQAPPPAAEPKPQARLPQHPDAPARCWRVLNDDDECSFKDMRWCIKEIRFGADTGYFKLPAGGRALADSEMSNATAEAPFTGRGHWSSAGGKARPKGQAYLGYDYGVPVAVTRLRLTQFGGHDSKRVLVQSSDDGHAWATVWAVDLRRQPLGKFVAEELRRPAPNSQTDGAQFN